MDSRAVKKKTRPPMGSGQIRPESRSAQLPVPAAPAHPTSPMQTTKALVSQAPTISKEAPIQKPSSRLSSLGGIFFGAAIALVVFALFLSPDSSQQRRPIRRDSARIEQIVNKHLVMTNSQIEIEQRKKDLELRERLHELGDTIHPRRLERPTGGVDMSPDRHELNAVNDLRAPSGSLNHNDPGTEIWRELAEQQRKMAEAEAYNKAYREAVAAEARRQGYELQFGPDGQITGARPLRQGTPR